MRNRPVEWGFSLALAGCLLVDSAAAQSAASDPTPPSQDTSAASVVFAPNEPHRELKEGKVIRAMRTSGLPPQIDGRLTDEVWTVAEAVGDLVQRDPDNGTPMTEPTRIQIAYDDRFVYVAVTCVDTQPASIASGLGRRDESPPTDSVTIGFDPRHDHQTAYAFSTNPSGWQGDFAFYDDDRRDGDYNAVWEVRTEITDRGWTAEYRIPFSQMRFTASAAAGQVWGFNIQRQVRRKSETGTWIAKPRGERGEVSLYGHIVFGDPLPSPKRLELTPYLLARSEHRPGIADEAGAAVGVDLRAGLGTAATFSATLNPDFGQVEQDPAVLNLSVFETFFPEKRPFFLEDSRTFVPPYGLFQLFHSRRIGRAPGRLPLADSDHVIDSPDETTILGATKLTGKKSEWTYGALSAITGPEYADVDTSVTSPDGTSRLVRAERLIEPMTSYNVVRLQRDVWRDTSNVGVIATGVFRDQIEDAFTGGFDYNLRWDQNRTGFNGHWVATRAPGPGGVKNGGGGLTNFNFSRKHVNTGGHYDHFGRDFRVNDIGFLRTRANRNQVNGYLEVGQPDPWKVFRRIWGFSSAAQGWNDDRLVFERFTENGVNMQFRNFWQVVFGGGRQLEAFDDLDTRGGPPILKPGATFIFFNVNSDSRKSWRWNGGGNAWRTSVGGAGGNSFTNLSIQPTDRVQASVGLTHNFGHEMAQWITNVDVTGDGADDHIYGALHRDVIDVTLRGTYSFTRDLTLQAYLQPFVAVGRYDNIRRLARAKSYEFEPASLTFNPDFNRKSLRGNIIMRWEYVRGSTLFFVWDLSQADLTRPGDFSPWRDLGGAFGADASHVFIIKASYWLNR